MANFNNILQQLQNFQNFGIQVVATPPLIIPQLAQVWQWETSVGLPYFDQQHHVNERFLPQTLLSRPFANTTVGQEFVQGMQGILPIFDINCNGNGGRVKDTKKSLLGMMLKEDIKKISVRSVGPSLEITKTTANLIPFVQIYDQRALRSTVGNNIWRNIGDFIEEINLNSARGFYGPGSFRCREPHCLVTGPLMTQAAVVEWGPQQFIPIRKRCTCASTNCVYLLHCDACLRLGRWTTYVGESEMENGNLHDRWTRHLTRLVDQRLRATYPPAILPGIVPQIMNGTRADPDLLMKDPYVHFTFVHPGARRYSILDAGFPTTAARKRCEQNYKVLCGNYVYNPATNSGSLNRLY